MAAKTRVGVGGSASAYAGFTAKATAINTTATVTFAGRHDGTVEVTGRHDATITLAGERDHGA